MSDAPLDLWVWRHPRPEHATGRCIGVTDVPLDPRKARRLADRIRRTARRHGLPHRVLTSTLQRSADVGRWLRRWGWRHEIVPTLVEMDFGDWDGRDWNDIPRDQIDAWCDDFLDRKPGDGESLADLFDRVARWRAEWCDGSGNDAPFLVVGHAGWMLAMRWIADGRPKPTSAAQWPAAPGFGACWHRSIERRS